MSMVHMVIELFAFFAKILSAPFETKLEDLIQDLPDAKIILNILNLSKKEMNMTLGEFFKYQMNMPESSLQKQFNFIARLRVFYEEIRQSNAIILQMMLKEDRDNYFAELALAYILEMAMLYDTLDLQSETERLAQIQKMIENYLNQLQSLYNVHNQLHDIGLQLADINVRKQEIIHELDKLTEKNFAITIDKYKHGQELLINDLTIQLHQIDSQITVQNTKLSQAEQDLVLLKERNEPEKVIQEKISEINELKTVISSLEDIKKDNTILLDKARVDLHSATELFNAGLASFGSPHDSKVTKLTSIQSILENNNQDTVSWVKDIKEKITDLQNSSPELVKQEMSDLVEQATAMQESTTINTDKFKTDNQENNELLHAYKEKLNSLDIEKEKLFKKQDKLLTQSGEIEKQMGTIAPQVHAEFRKAGIPAEASKLHDLVEFSKKRLAEQSSQKDDKPWPPSSFSNTEENIKMLLQKRNNNKNGPNPPKPPEPPDPPRNGFRHK